MAITKTKIIFGFVFLLVLALLYLQFRISRATKVAEDVGEVLQDEFTAPEGVVDTTKYDLYGEIQSFMNKQTKYVMGT